MTVPEGGNGLIQRSNLRQLLHVGFCVHVCLCLLSCMLNINSSVGTIDLHVYVHELVSHMFYLNFSGCDPHSKWWSSVAVVIINWLQGDDAAAERLYPTVEHLPRSLQSAELVEYMHAGTSACIRLCCIIHTCTLQLL